MAEKNNGNHLEAGGGNLPRGSDSYFMTQAPNLKNFQKHLASTLGCLLLISSIAVFGCKQNVDLLHEVAFLSMETEPGVVLYAENIRIGNRSQRQKKPPIVEVCGLFIREVSRRINGDHKRCIRSYDATRAGSIHCRNTLQHHLCYLATDEDSAGDSKIKCGTPPAVSYVEVNDQSLANFNVASQSGFRDRHSSPLTQLQLATGNYRLIHSGPKGKGSERETANENAHHSGFSHHG